MKTSITSAAGLILLAGICGCGAKPEDQLVGKWVFSSLDTGGAPDPQADAAKKQMQGGTLEFTKDKTATLTAHGQTAFSGKWTISNRDVSIVPTMIGGQTVEQAKSRFQALAAGNPRVANSPQYAKAMEALSGLKATLSGDGKTVTLLSGAGNAGSVTFTKS